VVAICSFGQGADDESQASTYDLPMADGQAHEARRLRTGEERSDGRPVPLIYTIIGSVIAALALINAPSRNADQSDGPQPETRLEGPPQKAGPFRDPITWATIASAIATAALVLTSILQWNALQGQLRTAIQANNDNRNALIQSQRAWLLAATIPVNFKFDTSNRLSEVYITPTFEKNGNSPAFRATCSDVMQPTDVGIGQNRGEPSAYRDIGPRQPMICESITLSAAQANDLWNKRFPLFVWARVEYHDAFDDTPPRHTDICGEITVIDDPTRVFVPGSQINLITIKGGPSHCNSAN
jgi:hypothetical protein